MKLSHRILAIALAASLLLASACSGIGQGRVWIPETKYQQAKKIYDDTGSLKLTAEKLRDDPTWRRAQVNEAIYRLEQEAELAAPASDDKPE